MLIFVLFIVLIVFMDMKVAPQNEFSRDYLSPKRTNAVNGIFVLLIFLSHVCGYIDIGGGAPLDTPYISLRGHLGQMVVVTFLFYSGYGIMESIKRKGISYVKGIPLKRFVRVLYHFDIAVGLFILLAVYRGSRLDLKNTLLALTSWTSIGNSNWYITAVLGLYLITFFAFIIARKHYYIGASIVTVLSVAFVYAQMLLDRAPYHYDTIILFAFGMWYSLLKEKIDKIIFRNDLIYFFAFTVAGGLYWYFFKNRGNGIEWYSIWGILFMSLVLLVTMKVEIGNNILHWFGKHTFSVYILQRIPMTLLRDWGIANSNKYAFVVLSFGLTCLMAELFDRSMDKLDGFIYKPRKKIAVCKEKGNYGENNS